ncbi:hypothetical protein ACQ4PT_052025 [Festuca glaucescens]
MARSSGCSVGQIWSGVSRTVSPSARQCLGAVVLLKMGFPEASYCYVMRSCSVPDGRRRDSGLPSATEVHQPLFHKHEINFAFAEAGRDVVDFLSGLLSLLLSTVANLLTTERMVGSIGNVLDSMEKLDANYKSKVLPLSLAVAPATPSRLQQLLGSQLGSSNLFTCEGPNTAPLAPEVDTMGAFGRL